MASSIILVAVTGYAMVQSIAFFLLFLTQRRIAHPIRWILAAISLNCGLIFVEKFLSLTYGFEQVPHAIFATGAFWYLFGPLLYLYLRAQFRQTQIKWLDLLHLLPFFFVVATSWDFYTFPAEAKIQYLESFSSGEFTAPVHNTNYILFCLQTLAYLLVSIHLVRRRTHGQKLKSWPKVWLGGMLTISFLGLFAVLSANSNSGQMMEWSAQFFLWWVTGFNICLFIGSMRSPQQLYFRFKPKVTDVANGDYKETMASITSYFSTHRPYFDPAYNIHQLAHVLGCSKNHLQLAIKQSTDLSFRDFLNHYRVQEAKRRLQQPESRHYTIQSIAEEVGFRSQATFYRVFKKIEGQTPATLLGKSPADN